MSAQGTIVMILLGILAAAVTFPAAFFFIIGFIIFSYYIR